MIGATSNVTPMSDTSISTLLEHKGSHVHSVEATLTVAEAVQEMNRHKIGAVLVTQDGELAGIFTERDVRTRVIAADLDPKTTIVAQVMTHHLITIEPEATVGDAMNIFADKRCRHLPIVDHGRLLGLVSIGDTSRWVANAHRAEAEHLKQYIAGGFPV